MIIPLSERELTCPRKVNSGWGDGKKGLRRRPTPSTRLLRRIQSDAAITPTERQGSSRHAFLPSAGIASDNSKRRTAMRRLLPVALLAFFILGLLPGCATQGEWFPKGPAKVRGFPTGYKSNSSSRPHGGIGNYSGDTRFQREPHGPKR